ncbi:glycosyltransferase family 2 protein [Tritonibacter scottomollicae]|uniref:glycosyltransferase family 2 protein n=1 Tax=Tritonibacter scottomollicae TaxID=483013 RepID=UPI003BAD86B4
MITLQNIIAPEIGICTENRLYYRETGAVGLDLEQGIYRVPPGCRIGFDTYFNLFNLDSWMAHCSLCGLLLEINGSGEAEVRVHQDLPGRSGEVIWSQVVRLTADAPLVLDLEDLLLEPHGVLSFSVTALSEPVTLSHARFATAHLPDVRRETLPELAISITTFQRETEVERTVTRLCAFLKTFAYGDHIRLQVVDNGQSASLPATDGLHVYPNHNYGGAGGFARGLLEAEAAGVSHCLFMDDDASFHMENIARAYMFLLLARDPRTALAGAMINTTHKWAIWESGAWFNGACRPLFNGVNLRNRARMMKMQHAQTGPQPDTLYGGWWFFAFPVAGLRHHPFPFFVRGDDISFSLANDFAIRTLNGVVSFQDDFTEKESAQTLYLDLRNHLIHHLVFDSLARSPLGTARVAIRFIMRSLLRLHYSSAQAQLLAWRDVMEGPEFFDTNIDMSARRSRIRDMAGDEAWQPVADLPHATPRKRIFTRVSRKLRTGLGLLTLNGHLIPFWSRMGSRIQQDISQRGLVYHALGAAEITFANTNRDKAYTLRHSKRRFFCIAWEMTRLTVRFMREFDQQKSTWRQGYTTMTTAQYWQEKLAPITGQTGSEQEK